MSPFFELQEKALNRSDGIPFKNCHSSSGSGYAEDEVYEAEASMLSYFLSPSDSDGIEVL
jgi:hypothetical protein